MKHICDKNNEKSCYSLELRDGYSSWIVRVNQPKNKEHHDKAVLAVDFCPWCGEKLRSREDVDFDQKIGGQI